MIAMSEAWTDEVLLRRLAAALDAAEAVPRDFVAAGKTAYAWHGIDTELADPELYAKNPARAADLTKARANAEKKLAETEEEWLLLSEELEAAE